MHPVLFTINWPALVTGALSWVINRFTEVVHKHEPEPEKITARIATSPREIHVCMHGQEC